MILTIAMIFEPWLLCSSFAADSAENSGNELKPRVSTIYYLSSTDEEPMLRYSNTGIIKNGDTKPIEVSLWDPNPIIWLEYNGIPDVEFLDPDIVDMVSSHVDNGQCILKLVLKDSGTAHIRFSVPADEKFAEWTGTLALVVKKHGQYLYHKDLVYDISQGGVQLDPKGNYVGELSYSSADTDIATVDETGYVTFRSAGITQLTIVAAETEGFDSATWSFNLKLTDRSANKPAPQQPDTGQNEADNTGNADNKADNKGSYTSGGSSHASAQSKTTAARKKVSAKKLKKPKLKCKRKKGRNKLTWSKVPGATGYQLYVRYPGTKKYVRALTKSSRIKSVTHRGLSRGKVYRYKVRAFVKTGKIKKYGPFSKVVKAKVK